MNCGKADDRKNKRIMHKNKGVTMVELIVTFALLAIFMGAATMCISHAIIFFYDEQQRMRAYTVADGVLSEIKAEIRTMQGSENGLNGYVKLRNSGATLEYITSNINDNMNAVQIDALGCKDFLLNGNDNTIREVTGADGKPTKTANLEEDYLTMRYYGRPSETNNTYKNLFEDEIVAGTTAGSTAELVAYIGKDVVWHVQEKLPKEFYQDHKIGLEFKVHTYDVEGVQYVDYIDVIVYVKNADKTETVYQKERRIALQNKVKYKTDSEATMYSDIH